MATESEDEPYTFAISLALNDLRETSNSSFSEFLVSVYQGFLIRAEKILKQLTSYPVIKLKTDSIVFKLSSSLLVLQRFFTVVPELHKNCITDEVARSGKNFLRNLFIASCKLLVTEGDHGNTTLMSVIHKQLAVLSQWLQYSQDLTQELRQSELLTKLLHILDKLPTTTSLNKATEDEVRATLSLLNIVKTCSQSGVGCSLTNSKLSQSVEPFLISPSVEIRVTSKMVLNCLDSYHGAVQILQKDELDFIIQKVSLEAQSQSADNDDYVSKTDLLTLLIACAHHKDNREIMLERNISDFLSDLIENGTEVEQALVAELVSIVLSESSSAPASSMQTSKSVTYTSNVLQEAEEPGSDDIVEDIQLCDEGSIEAVNILLCEIAKLMQAYLSHSSASNGLHMVAACLSLIWGLTKHSEELTKVGIADNIAQSPELVNACCEMLKYYPDMPPMPKAAISGILHQCLMQWTNLSQYICERLAESGMVLYLTGELEFLQSAMEMNEYVVMCLEMTLHVLLNCILAKNILPAFDFADTTTVLVPLASCIHLSIRIKTKSILSFLHCHIEDDSKLLQLSSEEQAFILQKLFTDTHAQPLSDTVDSISANYWLQILNGFGQIKENQGLLSTNEVFQLVSDVLTQGVESAQELVLQLLWDLLHSKIAKGMMEDQYPVIVRTLEDLQRHTNSSLQSLAFCILWDLGKSDPLDHLACLRYAKGCYQHGKYSECTSWCDHICQHASKQTVLNDAKLLKGKALYHSCEGKIRAFLKLKSTISPEHELQKLINECFTKTKESILLLGTAHDHNYLDDDGSKLLDWAMIDFIREANKLDDCKRCLLCRRKTSLKRSHIYPRSVLKVIAEPSVDEGEHRVYLHELRGKLSAKSAGEITYWMLCGICEERLSQNGENEFCKDFFTPIFQASQQVVKEDHMPTQSSTCNNISYGRWLYNFCIGILFRALAVSVMPHCRNREDIYIIFLNCRKYLLSLPVKIKEAPKQKQKGTPEWKKVSTLESTSQHIPLQSTDPRMHHVPVVILINPTTDNFVTKVERMPFLPATLLNSSTTALSSLKLDSGQPTFTLDAPFFLVRLGLVNILVEFKSINGAILNEKYCIKQDGGTYQIPSEDERWDSIPGGLWELFQKDAEHNQASNIEYFLRLASDHHLLKYILEDEDDMTEPSSKTDIPLVNAQTSEAENSQLELLLPTDAGKDPFLNSARLMQNFTIDIPIEAKLLQEQKLPTPECFSSEKHINLLPKGFSVFDQMGCLSHSSIVLPKSHRILLHATDTNTCVTVFLCTGAGNKFSPDCPYLIILLSHGDTTIIEGVILTPDGNIAGFVSDLERRSGTVHPFRQKAMPSIQVAVDVMLPHMLAENGFENLDAVIHWTKCHWSLQEFPSLDFKCVLNGCWYCSDLCNVCMLPSKVGLNRQVSGYTLQKFCSEKCLIVANEQDSNITIPISVALPLQKCGSLQHSKPELMSTLNLLFHAEKLVDTHLARNTLVKVSLLMDKSTTGNKLFVLQQLRTAEHQVILGFSISEELLILEPLICYMVNENVKTSFEKVKQEGYTKVIIEEALMEGFGHCSVQLLIEQQYI